MSLLDYWGTVKKRRIGSFTLSTDKDFTTLPKTNSDNRETVTGTLSKDGETSMEVPQDEVNEPRTDLESSLPVFDETPVRQRKSSIYVDAFELALDTVLGEEAHLFSHAEMEVFARWRALSYQARYLYVRLFLRKTSAWHRVGRLGGYSDISDLDAVVGELRVPGSGESSEDAVSGGGVESGLQGDTHDKDRPSPEKGVVFADGTEDITTLEEASSLLLLDELKAFAKEAKVNGKSKKDLLSALQRASQQQTGLDWTSNAVNRDSHFIQKILNHTGDCIRLSEGPRALFERVHLVFYRSTEWTEKSLTTIILAKISRRNFPEYVVCRSSSIFPSRDVLLEFEAALRTQYRIDSVLEFSGTPTTESLELVRDLADEVYPRWRTLLAQEQRKEDSDEGAYLRRFSPAWVYTRIIHKGLHPLARFKAYAEEHRLLTELLAQRLFHAARRGAWYQRKALLEEHYMWTLTPSDGQAEAQRKHWRRVALQTCEEGLQDPDCHLIYHHDLQKRIMKLEKALKVVKREQHDFTHVMLTKPVERTVQGIRIEEPPVPQDVSRRGRPTVWVDERDGGECRVESMCLNWYRDQGWKGFHSEGGIVRTLFTYLFYDILFTYVPNVFQTPYQTCPLDLHTDAFYATRASEINHRLVELTNGAAERILRDVHACHSPRQPCAIGLDWAVELNDLVDIVRCFRGEALAAICQVLAQEYQARGGGIPDLFLWCVPRKQVMFVEVKSENDRLSDTQRLWIHVLCGAGVRVELCNAVSTHTHTHTKDT
ncbi:VRR-NUC domain-containing protein [Aspergillus avenaceus]|uniref:Fanconi-associated nuclease n=1 Tax=Aspergillus avenaceus TaxID=36643 RepID=A0A5N6TRS5_ASPAV|nr:VRR-NUC domain-containing protein [Aspergillus avenaceus]